MTQTGPSSSRACAAKRAPPPRPSASGSPTATISGPRPPSSASKSSSWPAAQLTITRLTRAAASRPTWYAASGRPATGTSAFGRPAAASPSRSALPPARRIASTRPFSPSGASGPPDAFVLEAGRADHLGVEQVPPVDDEPGAHRVPDLRRGQRLELGPLGDDHGCVRPAHRLEHALLDRDAVQRGMRPDERVPATDLGPLCEEPRGEDDRRRFPHVVGVRLERQAQEGDGLAAQAAEVLLQLVDDPPLLELVDLDHGADELEVVAAVSGEQLQEGHVFWEARAAVAKPRTEVARSDAQIEAHAVRDLVDVRAQRLADVRDLVDEADPSLEAFVERRNAVAVGLVEGADHDPVGVHEVLNGPAHGEQLGIRVEAQPD